MAKDTRIVFGTGPIEELLTVRPDEIVRICFSHPGQLVDRASELGVRLEQVAKTELDRLAGQGANHQGMVAIVGPFRYADIEDIVAVANGADESALVVVLDGVTDPHNLGAVVRSAYLLGAHGLVIPQNRAVGVNSVATKSSAGATESLAIARVTNLSRALAELKAAGLWLACAASAESATPLWEFDATGDIGLVFGSEGHGVRPQVAKNCDFFVEIPMHGSGVGSLNVSVAAGVMLYEVSRQRAAG